MTNICIWVEKFSAIEVSVVLGIKKEIANPASTEWNLGPYISALTFTESF